jgi:hypothetical protein
VQDEPRGILNPGAIDDITRDAQGAVTLHVVQTTEWDGSDHLLLLVQEKLFNYLTFVADGELARTVPGQLSRWGVRVDCTSAPDARTAELLRTAAGEFEKLGGSLTVTVRPPPSADR